MTFPSPSQYPSSTIYPASATPPERSATSPASLPQFDAPFRLKPTGQVAVVEQDSAEEISAAVLNILVCPQGANIADPAFGAPSVLFDALPVDLTSIQTAVMAQEPRAQYTLQELAMAVDDASETILVTASVPAAPTDSQT